jgi:hypothetical protein
LLLNIAQPFDTFVMRAVLFALKLRKSHAAERLLHECLL